jgi:hypothetical protein
MDECKLGTVRNAMLASIHAAVDRQVCEFIGGLARTTVYAAPFAASGNAAPTARETATGYAAVVLAAVSHRWDLWC